MHQNLLRRRFPDRWAIAVDLVKVEKILKGLSSFLPVYPVEQFLEEVFYEDLFSFLARNRTKIDNVYRGSALGFVEPAIEIRGLTQEPCSGSSVRDQDVEATGEFASL